MKELPVPSEVLDAVCAAIDTGLHKDKAMQASIFKACGKLLIESSAELPEGHDIRQEEQSGGLIMLALSIIFAAEAEIPEMPELLAEIIVCGLDRAKEREDAK